MMTARETRTPEMMTSAPQKVVVVSKQSQMQDLLETVLGAGRYDVVFVESTQHAYSHIKRLSPDLIIVCLDVDDLDGFQVLSMLKLDEETKNIRLVTCTASAADEESQDDTLDYQDEVFCEAPAVCMN
jgi:CheY-like chemotaxis protein